MRTLILTLFAAASVRAEVTLPALFTDHMMLQRGLPIHVWGKARPGEKVSATLEGRTMEAVTKSDGRFSVYLPQMDAGGPYVLTIAGDNRITLSDVLVGDVWVASGQSNMGFAMNRTDNAEHEIASANYPRIRLFKVDLKVADAPQDDVKGSWQTCGPESVRNFSAVGYFFARHLHQALDVPMGVIQSAWGGTPAEAWTSMPSLQADAALKPVFDDWSDLLAAYPAAKVKYDEALAQWNTSDKSKPKPNPPPGPGHQWSPAGLYNAMIAPLTPYGIKGAIWYQGENNAGRRTGLIYGRLFQDMIVDWRRAWGVGDFPFFWVQLANYGKPAADSHWPETREGQFETLGLRNTGMAVAIDIGNPEDVHPTNKQDVGLRLALSARAVAYGQEVTSSGPLFRQAAVEGAAVRLYFDSVGGGLISRGRLQGFQIAGADKRFVDAAARIEGNTVVVSDSGVSEPLFVRYGWERSPVCTLYNAEGLPASPFRTDR